MVTVIDYIHIAFGAEFVNNVLIPIPFFAHFHRDLTHCFSLKKPFCNSWLSQLGMLFTNTDKKFTNAVKYIHRKEEHSANVISHV
jgi:hypothetical protein